MDEARLGSDLALLLDDELTRREADGVARRIRQARFEKVRDLRDFTALFCRHGRSCPGDPRAAPRSPALLFFQDLSPHVTVEKIVSRA